MDKIRWGTAATSRNIIASAFFIYPDMYSGSDNQRSKDKMLEFEHKIRESFSECTARRPDACPPPPPLRVHHVSGEPPPRTLPVCEAPRELQNVRQLKVRWLTHMYRSRIQHTGSKVQ